MRPKIAVIGSINMDLVFRAPKTPAPGENLFCKDFHMVPGGKGANQAVTTAKLGAESVMVARVGSDVFGESLLDDLRRHSVNTDLIIKDSETATGVALIVVNDEGENSILISSGANYRLSPADIDAVEAVIGSSDIILLQFEIPMETIARAVDVASKRGIPVVLDAGPARQCPIEVLSKVEILSPNEQETEALTGVKITDLYAAESAAHKLLAFGPKAVVIKLGAKGALLACGDTVRHIEGIKVPVVDTTAAGDVFSAALAVAYAQGRPIEEAVRYANYAGALAVTKFGAQPSTPTKDKLDAFIVKELGARS